MKYIIIKQLENVCDYQMWELPERENYVISRLFSATFSQMFASIDSQMLGTETDS